jgi:hypothetical protein
MQVAEWGVWDSMGEWIFTGALDDDPARRAAGYRDYLTERGVASGRHWDERQAIERKHPVGRRTIVKACASAEPPERKKIHR